MNPTDQLNAFAQSINLTVRGRYVDDITETDGQTFVSQVIDWTNMFLDELENELGVDGKPVDWWFMRSAGYELGTATLGGRSITLSDAIDKVLTDPRRYVDITVGTTVVSQWKVVHPRDMSNKSGESHTDRCSVIGTSLVFSRAFTSAESGGTITGDVTLALTRLSATKVGVLKLVKPKQLLILGVAKNMSLPDIVQGGLSPSFVQKFQDLLTNAIARSEASADSQIVEREDFSSIAGVY